AGLQWPPAVHRGCMETTGGSIRLEPAAVRTDGNRSPQRLIHHFGQIWRRKAEVFPADKLPQERFKKHKRKSRYSLQAAGGGKWNPAPEIALSATSPKE